MRSLSSAAIASTILAAISISPLYAQNEPPTAPSTQPDCRSEATPPPRAGEATPSPPLGDRLSESKGVICPPKGVDPGIVNKPPSTNAPMPVIPPPGTRGGSPGAEPK